MKPIHLVAVLNDPLRNDDLLKIKSIAEKGFILEPDLSHRWRPGAKAIAEYLSRNGLDAAAQQFLVRQEDLANHRAKPNNCSILKTAKFPGEITDGELEFLASDGLNVGRFCFRVGSSVANAWQDKLNDDPFVINAMLIGFCDDLTDQCKAMIEDSEEYSCWLDGTIKSMSSSKQEAVDDSLDLT